MFANIDKNDDFRISVDELKSALRKHNINLTADDMTMLRSHFRSKYKMDKITKKQFKDVLNMQFDRDCDERLAMRTLRNLKMKMQERNLHA